MSSDPLIQAFQSAQRATAKANDRIEMVCAMTSEVMHDNPARAVMGLLDLFCDVAALYGLLHEALRISVKVSGVDLNPLIEQRIRKAQSRKRRT